MHTGAAPAHAPRPRGAAWIRGCRQVSVVNVIELVADSESGWVDAVQNAVREAARTVRHITGVEVTNLTAVVEDGRISRYRANVNVAFGVEPLEERPAPRHGGL